MKWVLKGLSWNDNGKLVHHLKCSFWNATRKQPKTVPFKRRKTHVFWKPNPETGSIVFCGCFGSGGVTEGSLLIELRMFLGIPSGQTNIAGWQTTPMFNRKYIDTILVGLPEKQQKSIWNSVATQMLLNI